MKYKFSEVFRENPDGSLSPTQKIMAGGVTVSANASIKPGMIIGGVSFHQFMDRELEAEERDNILVITGIYSP